MKLKIEQSAPDFTLPDQEGKKHKLSDYKDGWVLIYFYPKDDTPGCTKEACSIRDNFPKFKKLKAIVLGISVDSVKSHNKFAEKYKLPFILLADEDKRVVKKYGVWAKKKFMGRQKSLVGTRIPKGALAADGKPIPRKYMGTLRTSFLINPMGKIAKIYEKVNPEVHAEEVLNYLNKKAVF